jgi:hypothetical protein
VPKGLFVATFIVGIVLALLPVPEWAGDSMYAVSVHIPVVLLAAGLVSMRIGLSCLAGFALGTIIRLVLFEHIALNMNYMAALTVSWIFLGQLVWAIPSAANRLAELPRRVNIFRPLLVILLIGVLAEFWVQTAFLALRPIYTWQGAETPLELANYGAVTWTFANLSLHRLTWLAVAVAGIAALARLWLNGVVQEPALDQREHGSKEGMVFIAERFVRASLKAIPREVIAGLTVTVLVAGIFTSIWEAAFFALLMMSLPWWHAQLSRHQTIATIHSISRRLPPAALFVCSIALVYVLGAALATLLRDVLGARTMTTLAIVIVMTTGIVGILWPQQLDSGLTNGEGPTGSNSKQEQAGDVSPLSLQKHLSERLARLTAVMGGFARSIAAKVIGGLLFVWASPAFAHHCSLLPGCECLTDPGALSALITAVVGLFFSQAHQERPLARKNGEILPSDLGLALLSREAYNADTKGINDYTRVSNEELARLGITPDQLNNDSTGFKAVLFERDGGYVLAFAGTDDWADWENNYYNEAEDVSKVTDAVFERERGLSQHEQATNIAKRLVKKGIDIQFTGHSLGGGLASLAAAVTGRHAVTFNAAGLSDATLSFYKVDRDVVSGIVAISHRGDPLGNLQQSVIFHGERSIGQKVLIGSNASKMLSFGYGWQHSIDAVIGSIRKNI